MLAVGVSQRHRQNYRSRQVAADGAQMQAVPGDDSDGSLAMRRRPRKDNNHDAIVHALRDIGCTVTSLAALGGGCPDLLVGYRGRNLLFEVKNGAAPPSDRKLTDPEIRWHGIWRGQVAVVYSPEDALDEVAKLTL